jgi:uncharacterized metal-binding protein
MIDVVICGGFSPGARVLRAAIRGVCEEKEIRVVTLTPAMAGIGQSVEEVRSMAPAQLVVIDACEGGCGIQSLAHFGLTPRAKLMLKKYPSCSEKNVQEAREKILDFLSGVSE